MSATPPATAATDIDELSINTIRSVIETARSAGENIDIYIGGVLCGSGEVVVIENKLGVRITDFREN